jgi:hypothetical protein
MEILLTIFTTSYTCITDLMLISENEERNRNKIASDKREIWVKLK